jgi:protoheme IX farnesyltransferase
MFKHYLTVTKPGIIVGNLIAAIAGYLLAAQGGGDLLGFIAMCLGTVFVIASGCVFNNIVDIDIDKLMARTQNRVLVRGLISKKHARLYSIGLGVTGFAILGFFSSVAAFLFAVLGFVVYAGLYTLQYKRNSTYGTLIGSISGACPPVMGYCAASGSFDMGALTLFLTFCLWQVPHSYAIAVYRFEDYKKANIPVMPIVDGVSSARKHMIAYIIAFIIMALMLFVFNYVGVVYAALTLVVGLIWLMTTIFDYKRLDDQVWAKRVFILSIVAIVNLSVVMSTDYTQSMQGVELLNNWALLR